MATIERSPPSPEPRPTGAVPDVDATPWYKRLGPGLITGAADDDPSGIVTYSQAGAQFGTGLLWSLLLTLPLMVAVQLVSARLGRISGRGLVANVRRHQSKRLAYAFVVVLVIANVINVGADLAAMGAVVRLLVGGPAWLYTLGFAAISLVLQVFVPYRRYSTYLKWLALTLLVYVVSAFAAHADWGAAAKATVWPPLQFSREYLLTVVAVFGTTISPYLFVWQAASEVEDTRLDAKAEPLNDAPEQAAVEISRINFDTWIGMSVSAVIAFCIMLTAAYALNAHGITDVASTEQAAKALEPVAGQFAALLFCLGVVGTGMLAVPVLAGSAAYAAAESMKWRRSLDDKPTSARAFYTTIAAVMVVGAAICFLPIDPARMLYWSAVLNGVAGAPVMIVLQLLSRRKEVVGRFPTPRLVHGLAWIATGGMCLAVLAMILTSVL